MFRRASTILLAAAAVYVLPANADCQSTGQSNPALTSGTPDAAALGTRGRGFVEYGRSDEAFGYTAEAGLGTWGGMLRATFAHGYQHDVWGIGYARMLVAKEAGKFGTWGAGVDLSGAMDLHNPAAVSSRAARLSIPLSLRWGSSSRLSIAPYIAPYGEIGRATSYQPSNCGEGLFCTWVPTGLFNTHALGIQSGVQLTAWRLSLEVGLKDVPKTEFGSTRYQIGTGLRLRFW